MEEKRPDNIQLLDLVGIRHENLQIAQKPKEKYV
jgi:hypothetical protein